MERNRFSTASTGDGGKGEAPVNKHVWLCSDYGKILVACIDPGWLVTDTGIEHWVGHNSAVMGCGVAFIIRTSGFRIGLLKELEAVNQAVNGIGNGKGVYMWSGCSTWETRKVTDITGLLLASCLLGQAAGNRYQCRRLGSLHQNGACFGIYRADVELCEEPE
jgi:hypothetical protein